MRPTLDVVDALRSQAPDAATALHALVVVDVGTLLTGPLGIPALYVAPEVQQPRFEQFREHRRQLGQVYAELARDVVPAGTPWTRGCSARSACTWSRWPRPCRGSSAGRSRSPRPASGPAG